MVREKRKCKKNGARNSGYGGRGRSINEGVKKNKRGPKFQPPLALFYLELLSQLRFDRFDSVKLELTNKKKSKQNQKKKEKKKEKMKK